MKLIKAQICEFTINRNENEEEVINVKWCEEVVRCKDCRWYRNFDGCFFSTAECEPEHFCSWGEREE